MSNTLRISGIDPESIVNGPGIRFTIFVQGCTHNCEGCHNPQTHDYNNPNAKDMSILDIMNEISNYPYIRGLTISGGDPLYYRNTDSVKSLCSRFKSEYPNKTIWIYTGYTYEYAIDHYKDLLSYADVLVDGPYIKEFRSLEHQYIGSTNQRIIDLKKSIESGSVIEYSIGG